MNETISYIKKNYPILVTYFGDNTIELDHYGYITVKNIRGGGYIIEKFNIKDVKIDKYINIGYNLGFKCKNGDCITNKYGSNNSSSFKTELLNIYLYSFNNEDDLNRMYKAFLNYQKLAKKDPFK